jgi:hypothetical protein
MEPSSLSSSGCCSVKLTTHWCKIGFIYSGDHTQLMPRAWGFECGARPAHLNFQYMFEPQGGDSAFVRILLFNYDSITPGLSFNERIESVGGAAVYIHEEAGSFTPFTLPILYESQDTPAFMHIWFSISREFGVGAPYSSASVGTTLWLDDVHLTGPTGIQEQDHQKSISIYPNPAGDRIWFKGMHLTGEVHVQVFDAKGAQVLDRRINDPGKGVDVHGLRPGVYSIVLLTHDGRSLRATWVKE